MKVDKIKDKIHSYLTESGVITEQYIEHPYRVIPSKVEKFLKKYPQVEKSMKPFLSTRLLQGYRKWLKWKEKNEDKLGGKPETVDSPSFGSKTFYKHDFDGMTGWAAIFQYLTAKQFKDSSLYSSKNESVTEGKKWYNDRKQWERARTKLSVSDDSENWDKDSKGKLISMWDDTKGSGWINETITESSNTPTMAKSGNDILVDTTFVQLSNKFGKLNHIWMGDFSLDTNDGKVEFSRVNKQIDGFSGRVHKLTGDSKAITTLLKNMKPKVVKESVNEGVNWKEFYTMAKDTSGHNPSFEKKYGKLLDVPHIKDAITNTKDFNSFMRHVKKFESINEALWPKSKLSSRFQFVLAPELKKKFKGIFYVDGYDLYHNNKMIMKINPDKDSVNSIVNHISRNRSIQKNESINEARTIIKTKDGKLHNYPNSKKTDVIKFLTKKGMNVVSNEKDLKSNMDFYVVESIGESVNEASRRATDFFGDSKHGKVIHRLLKGKWDSKKVQNYLDKIEENTPSDAQYVRIMDFIAGDLGLNIRKYKTVGEMEPEMIKSMETLYKDFLTESLGEGRKSLQDMIKDADRIKKEYNDLKKEYSKSKTETNKTRLAAKEEQLRRVANAIRQKRADEVDAKNESSVVDYQGMQRVGTSLPQTKEDDVELTESTEPKIITQLRDVMKSGYKKLKDPKSGKTMTVDSYSASAIVQVYDALKDPKNKEKFSSMGLLGMQSTAFKLIK